MLGRAGARLFSIVSLCLLANRSATNVVNVVNAVNQDKVSFQIFEIDGPLLDIMWCGNTNDVILVQSEVGTIYRSRDRGDSWKKLHSMMHQTGLSVIDDGQNKDIGKVRKMMQSPVDDNLVVFTGTNGINWVTEDCGANLRALNSGKRIHEFSYHPSQRSWALAAGWTSCADFADDEPCEIYKELYVTKDLGNSWQYLKSYVFDFAWGTTKFSSSLGKSKNYESRIFITNDPDLKGHQKTRERWKESVHLYYSDDFFKTQKNALDAGNSIVMTDHYMFVAKAISSETVKIHVSRAESGFLDFRLARMPKNYHITDHFTVMDTSEKSIFLYVSDDKVVNPVGNLFVSDGLGYRFTLSLQNIIKGGHAVDFETVESLDGTFIANRYDQNHGMGNNKIDGQVRQVTEEDIKEEEFSQAERSRMSTGSVNHKQMQTQSDAAKKVNRLNELEDFSQKIKTFVTHNKGATWELIKAPALDMRSQPTECFIEDGCSLHLQMYSHNELMFAPPYSQESAIGVVMAVGNLGQRLEHERGARRATFLSRDGGLSWSEISKIPLIYEFGDHGGLLLAAPNTQSTTQVRYSWNEGKSWTKLKVSESPIFIDNIIIEPKSTAQQFVIYGSYDNSTDEEEKDASSEQLLKEVGADVMITLDFSGLHEPRCQGVDKPGTDSSDFELWSPHDDGRHGSNNKCFLGQQVTYVRRKQDSECFNGEDFERQTMRVPCLCTEADYECDMNYIRNEAGHCELLPDPLSSSDSIVQSEQDEDCTLEGFYYVSQGYRKIPGNKCYGGVKLDPVKKACNSVAWIGQIFNFKTIALTVIIVACFFFGWPIIEALIVLIPFTDASSSIQKAKSYVGMATGYVQSAISGNSGQKNQGNPSNANYSRDLDAEPAAFMEDDDSDDDIGGKPSINLENQSDSDSDEKEETELIGGLNENQEDLLDLSDGNKAVNVPKLSGPK